MNSFSGIKDVDREILLAMTDKDLLKSCSLNKYLFNVVCDDNFFYQRLSLKYPNSLKYYSKEQDKNYRDYYLKVIYWISKMKENYGYSYIDGNPKTQYEIFEIVKYDVNYLLYKSSAKGELNLVKEAIKRGADIHAYNDEALRWASQNGHLDVVKYLVENGANIHSNDDFALRWSANAGHLEVVKYLVENGANIHANNDETLRSATKKEHLEVVKYIKSLQ